MLIVRGRRMTMRLIACALSRVASHRAALASDEAPTAAVSQGRGTGGGAGRGVLRREEWKERAMTCTRQHESGIRRSQAKAQRETASSGVAPSTRARNRLRMRRQHESWADPLKVEPTDPQRIPNGSPTDPQRISGPLPPAREARGSPSLRRRAVSLSMKPSERSSAWPRLPAGTEDVD